MDTPSIENRDYFHTVEDFLRMCQDVHVTSMALVALTDDEGTHDICAQFNCGPFELASCASVLQLHAAYDYMRVNDDTSEEKNDE